jgi:hypothetical protein
LKSTLAEPRAIAKIHHWLLSVDKNVQIDESGRIELLGSKRWFRAAIVGRNTRRKRLMFAVVGTLKGSDLQV